MPLHIIFLLNFTRRACLMWFNFINYIHLIFYFIPHRRWEWMLIDRVSACGVVAYSWGGCGQQFRIYWRWKFRPFVRHNPMHSDRRRVYNNRNWKEKRNEKEKQRKDNTESREWRDAVTVVWMGKLKTITRNNLWWCDVSVSMSPLSARVCVWISHTSASLHSTLKCKYIVHRTIDRWWKKKTSTLFIVDMIAVRRAHGTHTHTIKWNGQFSIVR